ncbi:MAG: hypothetical protein ACKO2C_11230 [Actinomycetes bacterium]
MSGEHELPDALRRSASDPGDDPVAARARGEAMLAEAGPRLVVGVAAVLDAWVEARALKVVGVWVGTSPDPGDVDRLREAVGVACRRVEDELRALIAEDPAEQRTTPPAIVRTVHREPGEVLASVGVPEVVRDPFAARALPEDRWSLAPADLAELDPELGALLLAWGLGKATVLRARAAGA